MTNLTKLATSALSGLAILGFASSAFATPSLANGEGSFAAHATLVETIKSAGVSVVVNHEDCDNGDGLMGYYSGRKRLLVICQDNRTPGSGKQVNWTPNDLDTLRHEAQHFIQDCMIGGNHDHSLRPVYKDPAGLAANVLGREGMVRIANAYRSRGASDAVIVLEWEAFSVAAMNVPLEQSGDIQRYCMGG